MVSDTLPAIPILDIRGATPVDAMRLHPDKARALVRAAAGTFGPGSRLLVSLVTPATDRISLNWLERGGNPYLREIREVAALLGLPGAISLNVCFEWGCTSTVWPQSLRLCRVLDWKFPLLGENLIVLRQDGEAGEFLNVTWPGLCGMFQGLAKGRFAAAVNQAPMRRHGRNRLSDWLTNRKIVAGQMALPPAHLLRRVFEIAKDYAAAKHMLCHSAIAVPAIFILSGVKAGEGCVIERIEQDFAVREMNGSQVCAANHFESDLNNARWEPRPIDSVGRAVCARGLTANETENFVWFKPPIANANSRLAFEADAATGALRLMGTAGARPVTTIFTLN